MIFELYNVIIISYYLKCSFIFLKMPSSEKQTLHSSITPVVLKLQVALPNNQPSLRHTLKHWTKTNHTCKHFNGKNVKFELAIIQYSNTES